MAEEGGRERIPKPERDSQPPSSSPAVHKSLGGKAVTGNATSQNAMAVWQMVELKISRVHIISE